MIGDPELIFLDEPTTGFDPSARRSAWEVISGLRALGKTVFLTTHYMDEAEHLADRIAVIAAGRIVADGTPQSLGGRDRMPAAIGFTLPAGLGAGDLPAGLGPLAEPGADGRVLLHSHRPLLHLQALAGWALARGFDLPDLDVHRPTLEDVYLGLTNEREHQLPRSLPAWMPGPTGGEDHRDPMDAKRIQLFIGRRRQRAWCPGW